jgi:hypothetical protein
MSAGRGLQQLLSGNGSSLSQQQQQQQQALAMHTQSSSDVAAAAAVEDAIDASVEKVELYPASAEEAEIAVTEQTEEQLLKASGGSAKLLSPHASRRLTASGALHEHEGIVEADGDSSGEAWLLQQQQRWMARQLFDAMPACIVCERCWTLCGGECTAAAGSSDAAVTAGAATAATADAAVDVQVKGSSATSSMAGDAVSKTSAAAPAAGSSSSSGSGSVSVTKGGWHRVDVWTGHVHAHATIIVRDKRYESQSRDLFAYLVNHMSL